MVSIILLCCCAIGFIALRKTFATADWRRMGLAFIALAASLMAMCSTTLLLGGTLKAWIFPLSVALSLIVLNNRRIETKISLLYLLYIAAAILATGAIYDKSYDSCSYHQETIAWLADGWNPYSLDPPPGEMSPWTMHYAKLIEICQACIAMSTGHLEMGKAINFVIVGAMCCIAWPELRKRFTARSSVAVMLVIVANPVLVGQLFTFYIDYTFYCYLIITLCCIIRLSEGSRSSVDWVVMALMLAMAAGTKFNVFFNECLVLLFWIIWQLWHRQYRLFRKTMAWSVAAGLVSVCLLFFHPYLTNLINNGNPLYPLLGSDVDIMTGNTPQIFLDHDNRVVNFFISLVAGPLHNSGKIFYTNDTRVGGYGVFMLPILLVVAWLAWKNRRRWPAAVYYVLIVTTLSCFIFSQSWWARYNPQLWLLAVVATMYAGRGLWRKVLVALALLTLVTGSARPAHNLLFTIETNKTISAMRGHTQRVPEMTKQHEMKFKEWGIEYVVAEDIDSTRCIVIPNEFLIELNTDN